MVRVSQALNVTVIQPRALPVGLPHAAERSEQDKTSGVQYDSVKFRRHHFLPAHDESVHRHVLCVTLRGCLGLQLASAFRIRVRITSTSKVLSIRFWHNLLQSRLK